MIRNGSPGEQSSVAAGWSKTPEIRIEALHGDLNVLDREVPVDPCPAPVSVLVPSRDLHTDGLWIRIPVIEVVARHCAQ